MTVNETLAIYSNYLVYGAMAAFTVSMIAFAASFAAMRTVDELPAESTATDLEAEAGGVAVATKVATGGPADDALPPGAARATSACPRCGSARSCSGSACSSAASP